jgi:hypothetical protein
VEGRLRWGSPADARRAGRPVGHPPPGQLPPQALAITAMPAIAVIARARHKERLDPEGLANSAVLPRMGDYKSARATGAGAQRPRPGRRDGRPEGGNRGRRMKPEFIQYASAKSGCAGLRRAHRRWRLPIFTGHPSPAAAQPRPCCWPWAPRAVMACGVLASGRARSGPPVRPSRKPPGPCRSRRRPGLRGSSRR